MCPVEPVPSLREDRVWELRARAAQADRVARGGAAARPAARGLAAAREDEGQAEGRQKRGGRARGSGGVAQGVSGSSLMFKAFGSGFHDFGQVAGCTGGVTSV